MIAWPRLGRFTSASLAGACGAGPMDGVARKYLLVGLSRCGICGGSLKVRGGHGHTSRRYYSCSSFYRSPRVGRSSKRCSAIGWCSHQRSAMGCAAIASERRIDHPAVDRTRARVRRDVHFADGGVPTGIRTRVLALKGPRPRPLDDGDSWRELSMLSRERRRSGRTRGGGILVGMGGAASRCTTAIRLSLSCYLAARRDG